MTNQAIKEEIAQRESIGEFIVGFDDLDPPMNYNEFIKYLKDNNEYPEDCGAWEHFEDDDPKDVAYLIETSCYNLITILTEFEKRMS